MFALFFYILLGLTYPSYSGSSDKHKCKSDTTYNTTDDDGPGGEAGNNPPNP